MRLVGQKEAIKLLREYDIHVTKSLIYDNKTEAVHSKISYPLVLKAVSEKIVHKTEEGAVITGINNKSELAHHLHKTEMNLKKKYPEEKISFMLQKQETGKEVIIGMKRDAQFGPVILFGMGGVFVEVFKDVAMRIAPISKKEIKGMIEEVKAFNILKGFRGEKGIGPHRVRL